MSFACFAGDDDSRDVVQQYGELVPTNPCNEIGPPNRRQQSHCNASEPKIPSEMAMAVINGFQIIDIDKQ